MIVGNYHFQLEYNRIAQDYKNRIIKQTSVCSFCGIGGLICLCLILMYSYNINLDLICIVLALVNGAATAMYAVKVRKTKLTQQEELVQFESNRLSMDLIEM